MKLSTFLLALGSVFLLLTASCGAMGMSLGQGSQADSAMLYGGAARPPGPPGADVAPPTPPCALSIIAQGLPAGLAPEGQSRSTHLTPRSQNVKTQLEERFAGRFLTIGGWRPGPDAYSADHGCGRALDVMVSPIGRPANAEQVANGFAIAAWAEQNARVLGLHYIIFQQCIWNVQRATESGCPRVAGGLDSTGWRALEDRGSVTQNHYDHVHLSVW